MRPRKKHRNLPARLHYSHGRYYYVAQNKWRPLSRDYAEALRLYAQREGSGGADMRGLVDRYLAEIAVKKSPKTKKEYDRLGAKARHIFAEFDPRQVRPHHIAKAIDHEARKHPTQANRLRQFLSTVFAHGVRWGVVDSNPCRDVKGISIPKRRRYISDVEFNAVKSAANPTIGCIMEFCYFTAQRIGDVLKVKRADITDQGVYFEQTKTGSRLLVKMAPGLKETIERAKKLHGKVSGLTLFHGRGGKAYSYFGVSAMFRRACKTAKVADFHIHDIRAKALTDAKHQGKDAQRLAGHKHGTMTDHYIKRREIEEADPPMFGASSIRQELGN